MLATVVGFVLAATDNASSWNTLLGLAAFLIFCFAIYTIVVKREVGWGLFLIFVAALVGPGGMSLLT